MDAQRRRPSSLVWIALATAFVVAGPVAVWAPTASLAASPAAVRDRGAEAFVQSQGQRLVSILYDKSLSDTGRLQAFSAAVDEIADVPRITRFVLGKYARSITPAQMQRFAPVFASYAQDVYRQRLSDFQADTLTVTGSLALKPGDVVVKTTMSGGEARDPVAVSFRVLGSGSSWKVADVEVAGVWLAITQQADFVSTIDNHGGSVDALTSRLEQLNHGQAAAAAKGR
jgi:phospholipid transport system substrate-binding protein